MKGVGKLYNNLSSLYIATDHFDSALYYQEKAIRLKREQNTEARSIAISMGQMAEIYRLKEDFDQAIAHYYEAIKIFEEISDKQLAGRYNRLIGQSYYRLQKTNKAYLHPVRHINAQ